MNSAAVLNKKIPISYFEAPSLGALLPKDFGASATSAIAQATLSFDRKLALLRQHGNFTLAYSAAFQDGLEYFSTEHGFIAYKMVRGTALALADPVTSPENCEALIRAFVKAKSDVSFCQVSHPTAQLLAGIGFKVNRMGTDIRIDLTNYKRKTLRRALNRVTNTGYVIKESSSASIGIDKIEAVSEGWRQTRTYKDREVCFLNRPIVHGDEVDVRKFFAFDRDGKLVAFSFYDPIYQDGRVVGYSTSFKRRLPDADPLICYAILQSAIDAFRQEGRNALYLGLSPMADIEDKEFRHCGFLSFCFGHAFVCPLFNRFIYPLQGHHAHKREFRGTPEQTYFAFNKGLLGLRALKMLCACNMF